MKETTKKEIINFLVNFASEITKIPYTVEELKKAFPFHSIFFPDEALVSFKQQRSVVTKMGMVLYPKVTELISLDRYRDVHLDYEIVGELEVAKVNAIDKIINELRTGKRKPNFFGENEEICRARGREKTGIRIIGDLFIRDFEPCPLFLEIKSPLPNLDVCAESKKKMLLFRAYMHDKNPQAFLAFPYNPFVRREHYSHSFTRKIMDIDNEVLIGEEMWNKLGGNGTYLELLEIIEEAKKRIFRQRQARIV